jgi:hypothetical protein
MTFDEHWAGPGVSVKTWKIGPKLSKRDGNTLTSIENDYQNSEMRNQILADSQSQNSAS